MLPAVYTWLNDLEVMRTYSMRWSPKTLGGVEQWYETVTGAGDTVLFAVYRSRDMALIGSTMLLNISHFHRIADYDIILGEKACWGQGYGTEATRLAVDDGFTALGLHNIMLTVRSYNERGVRAYSRAGFKIIGRRREARRFGGQAYDLIYMECLATEFASPVLQRLLPAHTETTGQA
jgi:RimJ/RimL family protein N-acetyltransferase